MNLLAIETSTESCSVALWLGGRCLERSERAPRRHAELVLPMAQALLDEAGITRAQLTHVAVGRGPGAFTGVRLGISVAQGLALALDLPVLPVSSLAALAMQAPAADREPIAALVDARMGEVYAGTFRRESGQLLAVGDECVTSPQSVALPDAYHWCAVGTGWGAYADVLRQRCTAPPRWAAAEACPQARDVACLAAARLEAGETGVPAREALPVYLRNHVAKTLAEQGR